MKYSFVVLLDDIKGLKKKLQNLYKMQNTQIILVGPEKYINQYPHCEYVIDNLENLGHACNVSMNKLKGEYINFSFASSFIEYSSLKRLSSQLSSNCPEKIYSFNEFKMYVANKLKHPSPLNSEVLSTVTNFNKFGLAIDGYFFHKSLLIGRQFNEELFSFSLNDWVIRMLDDEKQYCKFNNDYVNLLSIPVTNYDCSDSATKEWYIPFLENYVLPLLQNRSSYFIKIVAYYLILIRFCANANANNKQLFDENELQSFLDLVRKCFSYIPDEVIKSLYVENISQNYNNIMLVIKDSSYYVNLKKQSSCFNSCSQIPIIIEAINAEKRELTFDCSYNALDYIRMGMKLIVELDGKEIPFHENQVFSDTSFFGVSFRQKYTFHFTILRKNIKENSRLVFYLLNGKKKVSLGIIYSAAHVQARLTNNFSHSYWKYDGKNILLPGNNCIRFQQKGYFSRIKQELLLYHDFIKESPKKSLGYQALMLRIFYRLTKPFYYHKRIWVTFDKLYKGGDNGEYFYQYSQRRKKEHIHCYYVINKNSHDYKRLKGQRNVLKFKSLHEYLVVLNSEAVFATHCNPFNFLAFTSGKEKYFRDLMNFDVFCLQHGLTIQDIPQLQNRVRDNTKLYFCASELEIKNLLQPKYDYQDYDYLKRTGIPRFDGLKNHDQKEILITPTWRSNMANVKTNIGGTRPYYSEFKDTAYFKIFNTIINDQRLIDSAKKYGYQVTYLIHPTLTSQIKDFDTNDYVKIYTVTEDQSYEKLLTESSLMVTDYSGIQYDFAYMRKPIIYFHPEELPPHYGSGLDYEKEGFGPIVKTIDELIDLLCDSMKNHCQNKDEYIKRADNFFLYSDYNSCERIYDEAVKFLDEKKSYRD